MRTIITFFFCLFFSTYALAATPAEPSFRTLKGLAAYPWSEGLTVFLEVDEKNCKKAYGQKWRQKCAAFSGKAYNVAKGIEMRPQTKGHWQWSDTNTLQFIPADGSSIKPDTSYHIDLSKLYLAPSVKLAQKELIISTKPEAVRLLDLNFFLDPAPSAQHRLLCSVEFNYPLYTDPEIQLKHPQDLSFGKAELVWNGERDRLNISWPVQKLATKPSQCSIIFSGLGQISLDGAEINFSPATAKNGGALFTKNLPAENELFFIKSAELRNQADENLNTHYVLKLDSSLYADLNELSQNLSIYELPEYSSEESKEPCNWELAPAISAEVLQKSRKLSPIAIQKSHLPQSSLEFKIPVSPNRYILCIVDKNFKSASKQKLTKTYARIFHATPSGAEIGFLQPGNLLNLQSNTKLDLFSRELDEIDWQAQLIRDPFLALIASASWDPFRYPFSSSGLDASSFSISSSGKITLPKPEASKAQFSTLDLAQIVPKLQKTSGNQNSGGLFLITLNGKTQGKTVASAQRLILLTDLALIAKRFANGQMQVFVRKLNDEAPAANLPINILGANGLPVISGETDADGQLLFASLNGLEKEASPTAIVAGSTEHFAWLPLNDSSRELNYSNFEISGAHISPDDLNVYIFNQRDLYRPGEEMHFGCMTRKGNLDALPQDLPLFAELTDPRGSIIWTQAFKSGLYGLSSLSWPIPAEALSGRYILNVRSAKNGPVLQSKIARVEEFQPETLKLKIRAPQVKGWLEIKTVESRPEIAFNLHNLYGSPAVGNKVKAILELLPAQFRFQGFENYIFKDASEAKNLKRQLPECTTDQAGCASIKLPADLLGQGPALAQISAEGFTASGGRAVRAQSSLLTSPRPYMLGYALTGDLSDLKYIPQGAKAALHFIALNPELKKIALKDLKLSLAKISYLSALISDGNGSFKYEDHPLEEPIKQWQANCPADGFKLALDTAKVGDYLLRIQDNAGKELSSLNFSVIGERLALPDSALQAAKMRIKLNKKDYQPGEKVQLAISAPYAGYGLMSLEREGVSAWQWFKAPAGDSMHELRIPANFEGKGYLVVNFIRDQDSSRIYMSPLSYAVEALQINPVKRDLGLKLSAPEKMKPGENLKLQLSAKQKAKAILYAVDEGILQLSAYQTPKPLKALLQDRALDVRTIQALDLLMPNKSLVRQQSAFGGGMEGSSFSSAFQNPYKRKNEPPVVAWFADLDLGPDESEISIPIPDYYNGQLRVITLALSENGASQAQANVLIQAPFIISPQLPNFVAPQDRFKGKLLLANNGAEDENWQISIQDAPNFKILNSDPPSLTIKKGEEKLWSFELLAQDILGVQDLLFLAKSPNSQVLRKHNISLRPPSVKNTIIQAGNLQANKGLPPSPALYPEQAQSSASISSLPLPLAYSLGQYLDYYPYGCTEQLLSRCFANLILKNWLPIDADKYQKSLQACLSALRPRLTNDGLALWPNGPGNLLLTAYAADFLLNLRLEAKINSDDLLDLLCDNLAENCALNESSLEAARASAYAIWVLTREGRITTQLIEQLLQALQERQLIGWQNDLTGLLIAASQKELRLRNTVPFNQLQYQAEGFFDEFAQYALHMTLLSRYFPELLPEEQKQAFYEECEAALNQRRFATFSAAQAIRAINWLANDDGKNLLTASIHCPDQEGESFHWANGQAMTVKTDYCPQYQLKGDTKGLYWQISSTGFSRQTPNEPSTNGLIIEKEYLNSDGEPIKNAKLGEEIQVRIRARAEADLINDCVISDLLPAGLEMLLDNQDKSAVPEAIKYLDRQEDRMLLFMDLNLEPLEFVYKTRAIAEGDFIIPPATAEAMYNPYLNSQSAGSRFLISNE